MSQDVHYAEGEEASTTFLCLTATNHAFVIRFFFADVVIYPDFLAAGSTMHPQLIKSSPCCDEQVPFSHRR